MDIVLQDVLTYTLLYEGYKLEIMLQELVGNTIILLFAKSRLGFRHLLEM